MTKIPLKEILRLQRHGRCSLSTVIGTPNRLLTTKKVRKKDKKQTKYWLYDLSGSRLASGAIAMNLGTRKFVTTDQGIKEYFPDVDRYFNVKTWYEFYLDDDHQLQYRGIGRKIPLPNGYFDGKKVVLNRRKYLDYSARRVEYLTFGPSAFCYYDLHECTGNFVFYETGEKHTFYQPRRVFGYPPRELRWSLRGSYLGIRKWDRLHIYDVVKGESFNTNVYLSNDAISKYRWFTDDTVFVDNGYQNCLLYHVPTRRSLPFATKPKVEKKGWLARLLADPSHLSVFDPVNRLVILTSYRSTYFAVYQFPPMDILLALW